MVHMNIQMRFYYLPAFASAFAARPWRIPPPYRGGGRRGQNQPVEFHFFLLGNPGVVIHPLEWNCKVTFLNKPWALVWKYLPGGAKRKYDHGSAIFWRDAIPTHVLLQSDMCLAPIFDFHLFANEMEWRGMLIIEKNKCKNGILKWNFSTTPPPQIPFLRG